MVESQTDKKLKAFCTDNGGEYVSTKFKDFCSRKGIRRQFIVPYTLAQNGIYERMNHTIQEHVMSMLSMAKLTPEFWGKAVLTAMHIMHRSPSAPLNLKIPKEVWSRMPRQKTARQWARASYEVDELSTHEKSHITDEVLVEIPAHIFIAKFKDVVGDNIKTTIMPREIWTLHKRPEVADPVRAVYLEQFFRLSPWGIDYMRAHELMSFIQYDGKAMLIDRDGSKVEVLITTKIVNGALHSYPGTYDLIAKT
ncbi:hypothetical protein L7F22_030543 [Adiantum nelumboides]|nr:hypothetical protein [Adiantum nelumboides]